MKKLYLLFAALVALCVSSYVASAQEEDQCMLYLSYYQEYYKQGTLKSRVAAIPSWRKAYDACKPGTRQNLYIHGAELYRILINQNAGNAQYRSELIDTLMTLHKLRAQYYPKYADKAYAALSKDVNNLLKDNPAKAYELMSEVINIQGPKADPVSFVAQMNAAVALFQEGKLSVEQIITNYDKAVNCFSEIQKVDTTQNTRNLRTTMENAFINSKVASCENLIALFKDRYEECKGDIAEVTKIVRLMASTEDCTDNELYLKAVTQMHKLEPSANSAYYLFRLHASKKDVTSAIKYMNEAISSEGLDEMTKAQYNYELAAFSLKNGHYAKTVEAANKALALDKTLSPKCYMLMGHAWMGVSCGGDDIERRSKYWVAVDYFQKAKAADPELAEDANKQIGICAGYYPDTTDAFMYNVQAGQSYSVSCGGLSATTVVRTR